MRIPIIVLALLAVAACEPQPEGKPVARARIDGNATPGPTPTPVVSSQVESACRSIIFEDTPLTHCIAVPNRHRITMALGPEGEASSGSMAAFARLRGEDPAIAFAMNAGIFDEAGRPLGYFVEESNRIQTLDTGDGDGNFYMKPNGVFFGTGDKWEIRTSADFLANVGDRPEFGTQSGPMLVIDGNIHPEIRPDGPSKLIRNAVGLDDRGRAHFVISNAPISFGKLARFYRDMLKVDNALFLDDTVSALWNPSTDRLDSGDDIGPIVIVEKKGQEE